jgi:hypothetical protein
MFALENANPGLIPSLAARASTQINHAKLRHLEIPMKTRGMMLM